MRWQSKRMQTQRDSGASISLLRELLPIIKAKVAGLYCINGESLIEFPEKNKAEDFTAFQG